MKQIFICILMLLLFCHPAFSYDWTYECSEEAKQIYENKKIQVSCDKIAELIKNNQPREIYIAVRDAGLWKLQDCAAYIETNRYELVKYSYIRDAIAFYLLKMGDKSQLKVLAASFDKDARKVGDHPTVELFGFLEDWEVSGRRLAKHLSYADGAAAELAGSAILWRRYLYGETQFSENWFKYGAEEGVNKRVLNYFYEKYK